MVMEKFKLPSHWHSFISDISSNSQIWWEWNQPKIKKEGKKSSQFICDIGAYNDRNSYNNNMQIISFFYSEYSAGFVVVERADFFSSFSVYSLLLSSSSYGMCFKNIKKEKKLEPDILSSRQSLKDGLLLFAKDKTH